MANVIDKRVGCFICNYNKKDFVIGCVESLMRQSCKNIDIYVVDNASVDGSVEALREQFGNFVNVYINKENIGGSGGFDRGIKLALEHGYDYAVLLDNDVRVDEYAIEMMLSFMEENRDVGILGPTVLQMSNPDRIQDLGGTITDAYYMDGNYWGCLDVDMPDVVISDYISTCTAMLRMEAVKVFGSMPEENFIYWDDVELSKKCQLAGYRTAALNAAKVWHNMQTNNDTPFNKYYLTRNRLKYFSIYLDDHEMGKFKEQIFEDIFNRSFMYKYKGLISISTAFVNALEDFIKGLYGKAAEGRILEQKPVEPMIKGVLKGHDKIYVKADYRKPEHRYVVNRIKSFADKGAIVNTGRHFDCEGDCLKLAVCSHVREVTEDILPVVMVDKYLHCISTKEQYEVIKSYGKAFDEFKKQYWDNFSEAVNGMRKESVVVQLRNFDNKNSEHDGFVTMKKWLENRNNGKTFVEYFHEYGYKNIAIYGAGDLGRLLYEEIKNSDIKVAYFVDRNGEGILENDGIKVITVDRIKSMPDVDVVVITPVGNYAEISKVLAVEVPQLPTLSLREAVYEF